MNGTVIDIPGIAVSLTPYYLQDSTDTAYTIEFTDRTGNKAKVTIMFGRISDVTSDILK